MKESLIRSTFQRISPGLFDWRTKRKLLIFESDDWGSLYLPDETCVERLTQAGILPADSTGFWRFDCLEQSKDLEELFDVLSKYQDCRGRKAVFTFNTVMGNPDFDKIRESDFQDYHHQHFFDSYQQFNGEDLRDLWKAGMEAGLIKPQYHGREHVNVPRWMKDLRNNRADTRLAFENNFYCQNRSETSPINYLTAQWPDSVSDLRQIEMSTRTGLREFEQTFGFASQTFVASNYVLPEEIEKCTAECGVRMIQSQRRYRKPLVENHTSVFVFRYSGQINDYGQVYSVRNVFFEPSWQPSTNWVEQAFKQTVAAFRRGNPAIVSAHRLNFVGGKGPQNRETSLRYLSDYLRKVTQTFSDVEFLSSDELLTAMRVGSKIEKA